VGGACSRDRGGGNGGDPACHIFSLNLKKIGVISFIGGGGCFYHFFVVLNFFVLKYLITSTPPGGRQIVGFFFKGLGMFWGRKIQEHKIYDHQMSINRIIISSVEKICFRVKCFRVLGEHFSWKKRGTQDNFT